MKGIMLNFEKLLKEISSKQQIPDVKAYFRVFQEELGYLKLSDINLLGNVILKSFKTLQSIPQKVSLQILNSIFYVPFLFPIH